MAETRRLLFVERRRGDPEVSKTVASVFEWLEGREGIKKRDLLTTDESHGAALIAVVGDNPRALKGLAGDGVVMVLPGPIERETLSRWEKAYGSQFAAAARDWCDSTRLVTPRARLPTASR
ncbi:MAG: hypothetical protein V1723_04220 [Candidatus Uhrbacteria bacterium]